MSWVPTRLLYPLLTNMQVKQVKCNSDIKKPIQFTSNLIGSTILINTLTKEIEFNN